ncbi:putative wrky transcription factor 19 [Quercus suber]|uniref:Wrky transcription factor 19 n=1 Tax=Quercus suber TaxID=58331 RepID=A0AAW0KCV2_QUESU
MGSNTFKATSISFNCESMHHVDEGAAQLMGVRASPWSVFSVGKSPRLTELWFENLKRINFSNESVFPTTPSTLTRNSPNCSFGYGFSRSEALNLINCENITELEFFFEAGILPLVLEIISCKKLQKIPRLPQSIRRELWFENLKCINFSECDSITNLPNFCAPNLEEVDLSYCKTLVEVHESFGFLDKLQEWRLKHCEKLQILPSKLILKSLKYFNLEGCSSLGKFPNVHPIMKCLEILELSRSGIRGLPSSIEYLIALRTLYLYDCPNLSDLPDIIYKFQLPEELVFPTTQLILTSNSPNCSFGYGFSRLEALNLVNCENITELEFFLKLEFFPVLKYLYLSQTNIVNILEHISSFTRLVIVCKEFLVIGSTIIKYIIESETNFVIFSNTTILYFLIQIGEIIGNLPNKECEDARGDILMDIGPSTRFSHQVLSPSFSSYEDDDCEIIVSGIEIPSWFNFNHQSVENSISFWVGCEIPKITLCIAFGPEEAHRSGLFFIRFTFPSMVVKRNTIKCTCCPTKSGITRFPFPSARHGGCSSFVTFDTNSLPFQSFFPTSCGLNMYHDISNNEGV